MSQGEYLFRNPKAMLVMAIEALEDAAEALESLGACDDPNCHEENCNHALSKVRAVLSECGKGQN